MGLNNPCFSHPGCHTATWAIADLSTDLLQPFSRGFRGETGIYTRHNPNGVTRKRKAPATFSRRFLSEKLKDQGGGELRYRVPVQGVLHVADDIGAEFGALDLGRTFH